MTKEVTTAQRCVWHRDVCLLAPKNWYVRHGNTPHDKAHAYNQAIIAYAGGCITQDDHVLAAHG
jgi:hypothetical protein